MSKEIANAIKESVTEVIATYIGKTPELTDTKVRSDNVALGEVSAIIGLTGEKFRGTFIVSFEKELLFSIVASLFGETPKEINQEVIDAAGEITNMICGSFRRRFEKFGATLTASVPSMVTGKNHTITPLCKTPRLVFKYKIDNAHLIVEFCLDKTS